jgi:hypothetical protein
VSKTHERIKTMFDKIITSNEIKFNDLERKIYEFVCYLGRIIIKLIIEKQDQNIMKNRDKKNKKMEKSEYGII